MTNMQQNKGKLLLVRHGQTSANIDQVWHGHTDTPLTPLGEQQASQLGAYFHHYLPSVDMIFASPLRRARETAQQIGNSSSNPVNLDERLMEFGMGEWEGMDFESLRGELGFFAGMMTDEHHRAPGGESRFDVTTRVVDAVEEYRDQHPEKNIVVVAHGVAISCALAHWVTGDSAQWINYRHLNTAVTEINLDTSEIVFLNRTDHLSD